MAGAEFIKGMEVEVHSDDKDLRGVLFAATVLRSVTRKKKVLIEYRTLMADEKGSKPLREFVNVVNIRPTPPREVDRSFQFSDEVDAYHNDGWWEGVIVKVLENSRYLVYFRTGKEELEFAKSELRIHREWVHGIWVPPMEEEEDDRTKNKEKQEQDISASGSNRTTNQKLDSRPCTKCNTSPSAKNGEVTQSSLFVMPPPPPRPKSHRLSPRPNMEGECLQNNQVQSCKKLKKGQDGENSCFRVPTNSSTTIPNLGQENFKCFT